MLHLLTPVFLIWTRQQIRLFHAAYLTRAYTMICDVYQDEHKHCGPHLIYILWTLIN